MNDQVRTEVRVMKGLGLSPDGRRVVAGVTDPTAQGGMPHLWLLAAGEQPRQLTFHTGERGETDGGFSPEGDIVFLASQAGAVGLFRLPHGGGEPERLQLGRDGGALASHWGGLAPKQSLAVGGYAYSPDGRQLAVWADDPLPDAIKERRERKDDGYNYEEEGEPSRTHLYVLDASTGSARAVPIEGRFDSAEWSRDSSDLIVKTDPASDLTGPASTFWAVRRDTLAATRMDVSGTAEGVTFLPGRRQIVYTDQCADNAPQRCNDLMVKDVAGGTPRNLTRGFDGAIPSSFHVLPNGDLLMAIQTHFQTRLARVSTRTGMVRWIDTGYPASFSVVTNARQSAWAFAASSATLPTTAMLMPALLAKPIALVAPPLVPDTWAKVPSRIIRWQNEGQSIEGALYLPPMADHARVPLVVNVHGGPAGRFQDDYQPQVQMLVAEGWAVLEPNIRGSTGYGASFMAANKNDLGGADYRDVMAGVDAVLRDYPVDPDRMALIGYSYGGELASFAAGRTNRFRAIVSGAPVIDQISEYGTEDGSFYDRWYYGKPWLRFEDAWRQSPLSSVPKTTTPVLLLQGDADKTDPLGQSLEMFRALRQSGAPVALIIYPREGHPEALANFRAASSQEPWHGIDLRRRMFAFLRSAFAGDADPLAPARRDVP